MKNRLARENPFPSKPASSMNLVRKTKGIVLLVLSVTLLFYLPFKGKRYVEI
jgi:hypothetical protein